MTNWQHELKYADSLTLLECSIILATYNSTIGDIDFFIDLICTAIEAGSLSALPLPVNYMDPLRERDFKFNPVKFAVWAKSKGLAIEETVNNPSNPPRQYKPAHEYAPEWQLQTNQLKRENPTWKKPQIAQAVHTEIIMLDPNFPYTAETIARHFTTR